MLQPPRGLLSLTLGLICYCSFTAAIDLLDFGVDFGDVQFRRGSSLSSRAVDLDRPIIYYGRPFNSAFVSVAIG